MNKVKDQMKNLKILSEELEVQMALGKAEARDLIKAERKNLSTFIRKQQNELSDFGSPSSATRRSFLSATEDLESNLNQSLPTEAKGYDNYKTGVLKSIYKLEEIIKEKYPNLDSEMKSSLNGFKAKMDAYRVNLALHDKDDPQRVDRIKTDFSEKLTEVRSLLSKEETDHSKLDNFMEDISESFKYFKRAISDLSN